MCPQLSSWNQSYGQKLQWNWTFTWQHSVCCLPFCSEKSCSLWSCLTFPRKRLVPVYWIVGRKRMTILSPCNPTQTVISGQCCPIQFGNSIRRNNYWELSTSWCNIRHWHVLNSILFFFIIFILFALGMRRHRAPNFLFFFLVSNFGLIQSIAAGVRSRGIRWRPHVLLCMYFPNFSMRNHQQTQRKGMTTVSLELSQNNLCCNLKDRKSLCWKQAQ